MGKDYTVEKILDSKVNSKGNKEFKVKWKGFPISECTWEPYNHVKHLKDEIAEFEKSRKVVKSARKNVKPIVDKKKKKEVVESESESQSDDQSLNESKTISDVESDKSIELKPQPKKIEKPKNNSNKRQRKDSSESNDNSQIEIQSDEVNNFKKSIEEVKPKKKEKVSKSVEKIVEGSFKIDQAQEITKIKKNGKGWLLSISWKKKSNGQQPKETWVTNDEVKKSDPLLLANFYESKIQI